MKLLSIIIPIYNVELYVEKCLRSLMNQGILEHEYEIICVNDGSQDNSRDVVIDLQKEFKNIILIDQENKGVSEARNIGIDKSSGKYILFVDPDDYVIENSLHSILKIADIKKSQLTIPGYLFLDSDENEAGRKIIDVDNRNSLPGIEAYYLARKKRYIIADSSVGIIFEADFLKKNKLKYLPNVTLNEDVEFLIRVHCLAKKIIFTAILFYVVYARPGSAFRSNQSKTKKVRHGYLLASNNLKIFQGRNSLNEAQILFLNESIAKFILLAIYSGIKTCSFNEFKATVNDLRKFGLLRINLKGCSRYFRSFGSLYNISPLLTALLLVLYLKIEHWYYTIFRN